MTSENIHTSFRITLCKVFAFKTVETRLYMDSTRSWLSGRQTESDTEAVVMQIRYTPA